MALTYTVAMLVLLSSSLFGQSSNVQSDNKLDAAITSLATELRLLRSAIENSRVQIENSRVQQARLTILLERLRVQTDVVGKLQNRVDNLHAEMAALQLDMQKLADQAQTIEAQMRTAVELDRRSEMESQLKDANRGVKQYQQRIDGLHEQEARVQPSLDSEESKLQAITRILNDLDRSLSLEPSVTKN